MKSLMMLACVFLGVIVGGCAHRNAVTGVAAPALRKEQRMAIVGDRVLTRYYRGSQKIYDEMTVGSAGRLVRLFYAGGRCVMTESDEDGDGFLETITLFPDDVADMEVFLRQRDNSVLPFGSDELRDLKLEILRAFDRFEKAQTQRSRYPK